MIKGQQEGVFDGTVLYCDWGGVFHKSMYVLKIHRTGKEKLTFHDNFKTFKNVHFIGLFSRQNNLHPAETTARLVCPDVNCCDGRSPGSENIVCYRRG